MSSVKSVQLGKKLEKDVLNESSEVKNIPCLNDDTKKRSAIATNVDTTKQFNPLTSHADHNMQAISTSRKQQKTNAIIKKRIKLTAESKSRSIQKLNNEASISVTQCAKPKVISKLESQSTTRKLHKQNTVDNKKKKSDIHMKGNSTSAQLSMLPVDNPIKSSVALTQLNQGNSKHNIMRNLAAVINAEKLNISSSKNIPGASTHFHDSYLSYNMKNCTSTDQLYSNMIASYDAKQAYAEMNEKIYASTQQRLLNPDFSIESAVAFNSETSLDVICYGIQACPGKPNIPEIPITIQRSDYYTNILERQRARISRIVTKEEKPNMNLGVKSTPHLRRSVNHKSMKDTDPTIALDKSNPSVNRRIIIPHTQPQETNIIQPQKTAAMCNKKIITSKQKSSKNVTPKKLLTKPGTESKCSRNCVAAILERERLNEHNMKTNKEESNRNSTQMPDEDTDLKNITMQHAHVAYANFTKSIEEKGNRKSYTNPDPIKSVSIIKGEETDGSSKTQNAGNKFNKPSQNAEYKERKDKILIQPQCKERKNVMTRIEHPKWSDLVSKSKKVNMSTSLIDLLCNGGLKIKSNINAKNIIKDYLTVHKLVIVNLIRVINEINSLEVFTSAVKCLYQILILSHLLDEGEIFNVTHYMKPIRFTSLLNSISTLHIRFSSDKKFKTIAVYLYTKLVKIINATCKAEQCRIEIRKISKGPLKCLCILLQQQHNKDLINNLLDIFKLVCHCRSNCLLLSYKEFYDSLYASYQLTQKLNTVISILKLMARKRSSLILLGHQEKMISLLLEFINDESKTSLKRCAVIKMLHKIANDEKGLEILLRYDNYNKLYNYFLNCKDKQDCRYRMKTYSILNRLNTVVLTNSKLNVDLHLPDYILKHVNIHKEDKHKKEDSETDADSDESSDENDDNNDSSSSEELIKNSQDLQMLNINSLSSMEKYFCEYFSHPDDNNDAIKFIIYENTGMPLDSYTIQQRINRSQNLGGVAFPDAAMLAPEIDKRTVIVPEFPLEYLIQKLKCLHDNIKSGFTPRVVFDLDELYQSTDPIVLPQPNSYKPVNHCAHPKSGGLIFESRFECGNLRKVTHIDEFEYDLQLSPDTLTSRGFQWFYFQVSNMLSGTAYTFNIINFTKDKNLYNEGMLPVVFSTTNYVLNGIGWRRAGGRVVFHGNHYTNETSDMQYKTLTFSIIFPFMCDYVYIAYHYPYTYTRLMVILSPCVHLTSAQIYSRIDKLCNTVNNANEVPLLTVTAALNHPKSLRIPFNKRPIIILTARVHPGETNASWIMEGMIKYLLSETNAFAAVAREYYIFKLIPMLNPEGVIYGNTRCGLLGEDLNRCWAKPSDTMCPEIYFTKRVIEFAKGQSKIPIGAYIDIHGHSKNKFFFLYGCNPKLSWNRRDHIKGNLTNTLQILPKAIQNLNPNIQLSYCKNSITKSRERTGRVVMWRELGITHSYTLECSFAECWKKQSVNSKLLTEIGESVIAALGNIADKAYKVKGSISSLNLDYKNLENGDSIQSTSEGITQQPPSNFCNTSSPPTRPVITM